ncbi:hypothetical protein GMDG_07052 [Pseudogymnoascus destructans 20631-21]|uniref:Uncharacterized protein n=1 Tax=Pseudogymnoascus destructans (strain ATCC MYA-4855 / 20631-21) TaxID=658429 RepID=L8FVB7_PSED2|nr:hypothetical protein GMDG_07052 [Pseudogymnoascus destructans 20631-21]
MAEILATIDGVAAVLQLAETPAKALIKTIRIVKELREVPKKLAKLLGEIETSTSNVEYLCDSLFQHDSKFYQQISSLSLGRAHKQLDHPTRSDFGD